MTECRRSLIVAMLVSAGLMACSSGPAFADIATSKVPCTNPQRQEVAVAMAKAKEGVLASLKELESTDSSAVDRYTLWFGAPSSTNVAEVKSVYSKSLLYLSIAEFWCPVANSPELRWNANEPAAAYPPNAPTAVYFSPEFFDLAVSGPDSKAGTVLHELTHLAAVKGAADHGYGVAEAKALATNHPRMARNNADNYQYFLEDVLFGL